MTPGTSVRSWAAVSLAVLELAGLGCARVSVAYEPHKAEYRNGLPPLLFVAVVAHRGDIEALASAGAEMLGSMRGDGNALAGHGYIEKEVQTEAAALGATHILLTAESSTVDRTPDRFVTTCDKKGNCTTSNTGGIAYSLESSGYVLSRVPRERWAQLPVALQPGEANFKPKPRQAPVERCRQDGRGRPVCKSARSAAKSCVTASGDKRACAPRQMER